MFERLSVKTKIASGFAVALIALVALGAVSYLSTRDLLAARRLSKHTIEVEQAVSAILNAMLEAQTSKRGFMLVGDESLLDPYRSATQAFDAAMKEVSALTADNPNQQARLKSLSGFAKEYFDDSVEQIALRRRGGVEAAAQTVRDGATLELMDDIRGVIRDMLDEEQALQVERDAAAVATADFTFNSIIYGTIGAALLLLISGLVIIRSITIPVGAAVGNLSSATAEILAATTQLASGSQEQAAAVSETVTTVDEVTQTSERSTSIS